MKWYYAPMYSTNNLKIRDEIELQDFEEVLDMLEAYGDRQQDAVEEFKSDENYYKQLNTGYDINLDIYICSVEEDIKKVEEIYKNFVDRRLGEIFDKTQIFTPIEFNNQEMIKFLESDFCSKRFCCTEFLKDAPFDKVYIFTKRLMKSAPLHIELDYKDEEYVTSS